MELERRVGKWLMTFFGGWCNPVMKFSSLTLQILTYETIVYKNKLFIMIYYN